MSKGKATERSFKQAAKKIERALKTLDTGIASGLRVIGEEIMTDIKANSAGHGVPQDEGILKGSGRVTGPTNGEVTLSFGGAAAPYALRQHEDLTLRHRIGEARYLVRGLDRWKPDGSAAYNALKRNAQAGLDAAGVSLPDL